MLNDRHPNFHERLAQTIFLIAIFNSLSHPVVRKACLTYVAEMGMEMEMPEMGWGMEMGVAG